MSEDVRRVHALLWIVWGAMALSLGVYALLPFLLPAPDAPPPAPSLPLIGGLLGVAVFLGFASIAIRHFALTRPVRTRQLDIDQPAGATRWFQVSVAVWALSESLGILGLLLWFLTREQGFLYPFLSGAALLFVVHAPRASSLRDPRARNLARPDLKIG